MDKKLLENKYFKGLVIFGGVAFSLLVLFKKVLPKKPNSQLRKLIFSANPLCIERLPTTEHTITDQDLSFVVYMVSQTSSKPLRGTSTTNPFLYPFEPGILIKNYGNSYRLLFNKYPIINKHLLLVTFQFEKQSDPLTKEDLEKTYEVIKEIDGFAFFNSGENSGYSQEHKHVQIVPYESVPRFPLDSYVVAGNQDTAFTIPIYDFKHFFHNIPSNCEKPDLHRIYLKLLSLLSPSSYNLIITKNWMLMVSRIKEKSFNRFDLNSIAYAGFLLAKTPEDLEFMRKVGPLEILRETAAKI